MYSAYYDEDNAPMNEEMYDRIDDHGHNPTVYGSYAEMKAAERGDLDGLSERKVPTQKAVQD